MIYTIKITSSPASNDFISKLPFELTFSNSDSDEYYIIGRSSNTFINYYQKDLTYIQGDIALLKDNTYIVFKETTFYQKESIYIGNIINFDNILTTLDTNSKNTQFDNNLAFSSETQCSPYIIPINGENNINVPMDKYYEEKYTILYYYGIINFSTRGTEKLKKVPPIYLNNLYLGSDCSIENDQYSIKCTIKDTWYHVNAPKPVEYKVNELYEGCYGPIFTGITLYISGESLYVNIFLLLLLLMIIVF